MALWLWRVGKRFCWWCFTRFCNKWSIWIHNITVSSEIHGPIVKFPENISIGKIMPHGMCNPLFWYLTLTYISRLQIPFLKIHELIKCISDVDFFFVEMLSWLWNEIKIKVLKKHRTKQKKANTYLDNSCVGDESWRIKHQIYRYYLLQDTAYHLSLSMVDYILNWKLVLCISDIKLWLNVFRNRTI